MYPLADIEGYALLDSITTTDIIVKYLLNS